MLKPKVLPAKAIRPLKNLLLQARTLLFASDRGELYGYIAIGTISITLRILLSCVNRQANDNHLPVIQHLMTSFRSLSQVDCRECFHPKFYYLFCVLVFKYFGVTAADIQIVVGQLLNAASGIVAIAITFLFLKNHRGPSRCKLITFALLALNPKFIGVNGQLSNDSFAIMFSSAAVYLTFCLFKTGSVQTFIILQFAISLALMTKGSTWVVAIAIFMVLALRAIFDRAQLRRFGLFAFYNLLVAAGSIYFSDYDFGSYDIYVNRAKGKPLYFFEPTVVGRPGVISIAESYLTFRYFDLLSHPMNTHARAPIPRHRTSLWTQLFGRTHFAHFDDHPPSWIARSPVVMQLGRAIMLLALPTLVCLLVGLSTHVASFQSGLRAQGWKFLALGEEYLALLIAVGYAGFIVFFTYSYRDFSAMKAIYLFPGIIAFTILFHDGFELITRWLARFPKLQQLLRGSLLLLVILYIFDIGILVNQLRP